MDGLFALVGDEKLLCRLDPKTHRTQTVVPNKFRKTLVQLYHDSLYGGHRSTGRIYNVIRERYYFPHMFRYVDNYCRACPVCQIHRTKPRPSYPLRPSTIFNGAFLCVNIDLLVSLPPSSYSYQDLLYRRLSKDSGKCTFKPVKYKHLLVVICQSTSFGKAIPLESLHIETVMAAFVRSVLLQTGNLISIKSDNGSNLVGKLALALYRKLGIRSITSTPFHPNTNGAVEKLNSHILFGLRTYLKSKHTKWVDALPFVMYALNTAVSKTTTYSAQELEYGRQPLDMWNLRLGGELGPPGTDVTLSEFMGNWSQARDIAHAKRLLSQKQMKKQYDKHLKPVDFQPLDLVYLKMVPKTTSDQKDEVKRKLLPRDTGVYRILNVDKLSRICQLLFL